MVGEDSGWFLGCTGPATLTEPRFAWVPDRTQHAPFIFWLVDSVQPSFVAELGAGLEPSYLALCQAIGMLDTYCEAICITSEVLDGDHEQPSAPSGELADLHTAHYASFSRIVEMSAGDAVNSIADGVIDVLQVGSGLADLATFEQWLPKLSDRAVVLAFGTHHMDPRPAESGVWDALSGRYPAFEFMHGNGLGVFAVGAEVPSGIQLLIDVGQDPHRSKLLRNYYARLGRLTQLEGQVVELTRASVRATELELDRADQLRERISEREIHRQTEAQLVRDLKKERAKLRATKAEVNGLKASTSWKITKPLRVAGRSPRSSRRNKEADGSNSGGNSSGGDGPTHSPVRDTELLDPVTAPKRILFVSGEPNTPGHRYRVEDIASALPTGNFEVSITRLDQVLDRIDSVPSFDAVWFWRARASKAATAVIAAARAAGVQVVADIDDMVFTSSLLRPADIDGFRSIGVDTATLDPLFRSRAKILAAADQRIGTTRTLVEALELDLGPAVEINNGYDAESWQVSELAFSTRANDGLIRIGYAGGTLTHQRDLAVAVPALARVLTENADVRLVLFEGCVNLMEFPELLDHVGQIEWRQRVPITAMPFEYSRFAVNIAPLEAENVFCEAKSALKFFEAALVRVPTVASPTEPFRQLMRNDENGFLASDDAQWYAALSHLVRVPPDRLRLARQARQDVIWNCGPLRRGRLVAEVLNHPVRSSVDAVDPACRWPITTYPWLGASDARLLFEFSRPIPVTVTVVVVIDESIPAAIRTLDSIVKNGGSGVDLVVLARGFELVTSGSISDWFSTHRSGFARLRALSIVSDSNKIRMLNAAMSEAAGRSVALLPEGSELTEGTLARALGDLERMGVAKRPLRSPGVNEGVHSSEQAWLVSLEAWAAVGGFDDELRSIDEVLDSLANGDMNVR